MKKSLFILIILFTIQTFGQSNFKSFFKLSPPIKKWVFFHPFKATRSLKISKETNRVSDSIAKTDVLDKDGAGGQVDAFRHAFWMARLSQEMGENSARSLGEAHEKENYLTYKKQKLEDGVVPDEISSEMDLHNNEEGLKLITKGSLVSKKGLIYRIINAINKGKMKIIKKDKKGNFLTCKGEVIKREELKGKWKNNKCLIASNKQ
ncbi:hypothetical protein MPF19_01550 [Polaribacter sp. Z014]|uniref:DUF6973 domain-containing protein n=1 Tax=unclassified Polaribacter TaxID=196858 RepID=UPI00193C54EA|nr:MULTISPECIES: hypothetical protein [unclassified Polaribacter]MCL7762081.1 hypothetical protein [Polaribacter sp. Z014]QVY64488.1 hypothetical protein JOP69_11995 [Polaribacter sp. Q13]